MKSKTGSVHGGNIHTFLRNPQSGSGQWLDFSANINPLGPPDWLRAVINRQLEQVINYPDPESIDFRKAVAKYHQVDHSCVVAANGTTELLYLLPSLFPLRRIVLPVPSYVDYAHVFERNNRQVHFLPLSKEKEFCLDGEQLSKQLTDNDLVIIGSPNNPTGTVVPSSLLIELAAQFPQTLFVIDEAFLEFVGSGMSVAAKASNIITLHSMTKFYAVPGLRLGYGIFPRQIAEKIQATMPPWTVNHLAQQVGIKCIDDSKYQEKSRNVVNDLRKELMSKLEQLPGLEIIPSTANYLLIKVTAVSPVTPVELYNRLLKEHIIIRLCDNYQGLDDSYCRIAVRPRNENQRLVEEIGKIVKPIYERKISAKADMAKSIMFQGTSSNAGKSVLSAALCRILLQDGLRVAPFKAQNMSLNSYVTLNGLEMGRAQVVQAQAARLDPDVRMNPVLLKPNSDTGSQVIIHGKVVDNMTVTDYHNYKQQAMGAARTSYDELATEYDVIVLEGAGSPGEVNLKENDFVNMAMADYAKAPVLLVGDIDRGGVYASFIGTMDVLNESERKRVAGFIVNRFRGLESLLDSAHQIVKDYTGKDVLGVVPYLVNLGLPEEDSVSFKAGLFESHRPTTDHVDMALIHLPHISNFTDVEPFLEEPDVHLRVISKASELGRPDVILLPGSKNVMGDIRMLKENGIADEIIKCSLKGCEIVGICGGYQILGKVIRDPHGIESNEGVTKGLGLLEMETTLDSNKTLTRKEGIHLSSGKEVHGYEIHHGLSRSDLPHVFAFDDNTGCGITSKDEMIWGAYLHGLFDSDLFRRWFIDRLRARKGLKKFNTVIAPYDLEPAFDRLATSVRHHIDMERIYKLLKI